jgi:hypothetical protein
LVGRVLHLTFLSTNKGNNTTVNLAMFEREEAAALATIHM